MSSGRLLSLSSPIAPPRLQCRPPALAPVYRAGPITAPAVPLRLICPALPVAGVPSMRIKQASKRRAGVICYAAPLRPHTLQWVSAASMAVLMFAKGTAIHKSFLLPLVVLQAPSSVISWIRGDYGTWTAFLALLVRIFYYLAGVPGVLYVRSDMDEGYGKKDYSYSDPLPVNHLKPDECSSSFSSFSKNNEYWLVRMDKPGVEVVSKAQMVDYYAQALTKVLGNEKDAQVCIYHISWEKDFGFCCQIDYECARELADVPGVLSVQTDLNHESETKNYKGNDSNLSEAEVKQVPNIRTKRLFVTGLSFYTSEKTLREAFEGFGELIEVKIIMDKISKRSKGYAFIEYTTEEAASAALKEMNGKIINGWMIVVDIAKTNPPRYSRGQPRPSPSSTSSSY